MLAKPHTIRPLRFFVIASHTETTTTSLAHQITKKLMPQSMTATAFLTAEWRNIVMMNYEIAPSVLEHRIPRGTEPDSHEGKTFVSVVGFQFLRTRLLGLPIPFHRNFPEVNLRFYVRRTVGGEVRRGVVFIREIVPLPAIAHTARLIYNEPYITLPMRENVQMLPDNSAQGAPIADPSLQGTMRYQWRRKGMSQNSWEHLSASVEGTPKPLVAGSLEEFIAEHYWGYTSQRDGSTIEYNVQHPSWRVWQPRESSLLVDAAALWGEPFADITHCAPDSVFVADGSAISVGKPLRI